MAQFLDRASMTVASPPGTAAAALNAAVAGYQTFAAAGATNGAVISYFIVDGANWEYGHGTYSSSGPTLTRTTILGSSNGGAAINASSGAIVTAGLVAEDVAAFLTAITSATVIAALGFTPYNASNPSGFISAITSAMVTAALGFTPYNASNPNGYISGVPTTWGAVGTYAHGNGSTSGMTPGATCAGSTITTYPNITGYAYGSLSGTWQFMGTYSGSSGQTYGLWLRIA
jgi:hypothetical protein